MKSNITLEDTCTSYNEMISTLQNHFIHVNRDDPEEIKQANNFYNWTSLKTRLISNEHSFQIPPSALPNTIKNSSFQWLKTEKQNIILKYYKFDPETNQYIISVKKDNLPNDDVEMIMRSLVLIRKTVIWVDFGYNIGTEFGGRHPAIILKNLKDSLVVIPLSSQSPKTMDYSVKVDRVYGFPLMPRWANVTRITQVSLSRVHFGKTGDVKPSVLSDISNKLKSCGII